MGPLVKVKRTHPLARLPNYAKCGDAGADVYSVEEARLLPGETKVIDLGFSIELPPGWECQVRSRSGNSVKGLVVANSPGTIDSGYRGPCKAIMHNQSFATIQVDIGDRLAQFVVKQVEQAVFEDVEELGSSERGSGGLGSTGK
jgi:dUTP pyrophosphatase